MSAPSTMSPEIPEKQSRYSSRDILSNRPGKALQPSKAHYSRPEPALESKIRQEYDTSALFTRLEDRTDLYNLLDRSDPSMTASLARRLAGLLAFGLGPTLMAGQSPESPADSGGPAVYAAEVDSIIHPVSAEYMITTMDRADREGAALVVFTLRTPGGLVDSTRDIISHMLASRTPVVIFIGPSGARAASAGFLLTIAADVAAMAPGTHIGAAHPVTGNGEKMDETMAKKVAA